MSDPFRQDYKVLTGYQRDTIFIFKAKAENLLHELEVAEANQVELTVDKRCMALAKTNLEQAIMWAVKAVT